MERGRVPSQAALNFRREIFRDQVRRAADCPECGAKKTTRCIGPDGSGRRANHEARIEAWSAATGQEFMPAWKRRLDDAKERKAGFVAAGPAQDYVEYTG